MNKKKSLDSKDEFQKYKKDNIKIRLIYENERERYLGEKDLDMDVERAYLKAKIDSYDKGFANKFYIYIISMFIVFITGYLSASNLIALCVEVGILILLAVICSIYIKNKNKKYENEILYFKVRLMVIEDLQQTNRMKSKVFEGKFLNQCE